MPSRKHSLVQEWRYLTFMHWKVDSEKIIPYLPKGLELDLYKGQAYVSVIPFLMKNVRPRLAIPLPGVSTFPEFNIRTYVKKNGKPGVLFLTLDAQSRITCFYAPRAFGLPYRYSKGHISHKENTYAWYSKREEDSLELEGSSQIIDGQKISKLGSIEEFLFERYCFYTNYKKSLFIAHTKHNPWIFYNAKVNIKKNNLTESYDLGITNVLKPDLSHMADGVFVYAWSLEQVF